MKKMKGIKGLERDEERGIPFQECTIMPMSKLLGDLESLSKKGFNDFIFIFYGH